MKCDVGTSGCQDTIFQWICFSDIAIPLPNQWISSECKEFLFFGAEVHGDIDVVNKNV
jgi:hypothetical protein